MLISVALCTRNRAASLAITLRQYFEQRFSGDYAHELIVVDNGSNDATREVIETCAVAHPQVRYVHEAQSGLSHARNAALAAARGEIIVFTDDDVRPDPGWLDQIAAEFASSPQLGMLGGRVLLAHGGLQKVSYQPSMERQEFAFPASGSFVIGANMAFRREVFGRVGGFDTRLGAGAWFAGAEEVDLFYRALRAGYTQRYAPNILVHHDHDRTQIEQVCHMEFSYGKGLSGHLVKHVLCGDGVALRRLVRLVLSQPARWRQHAGEDCEAALRRRAQSRGVLLGLVAAPFAMWPRAEARAFAAPGAR